MRLLFTIIIAIVLMSPVSSGAWFSSVGTDCRALHPPDSDLTGGAGEFVFYDNDIDPPSSFKKSILRSARDSFIPLDRIEADIPLRILMTRSASSLESLDALLLAKVRISLLIKEYKELRARAEKLLKTISIPYFESFSGQTKGLSTDSVHRERETLERKVQEINQFRYSRSLDGPEKNPAPIPVPFSLALASKDRNTIPGDTIPADTVKGGDGREISSKDLTNQVWEPLRARMGEEQVVELPYIVKVFLKASAYLLSHKTEVGFLGAVLFLILHFLSLKARQ